MIILKELKWDNFFSYRDNNILKLNDYNLCQITGKNGSGKSGIALIIQELLYGKNHKGIKKLDLSNRYLSGNKLNASIKFEKDGNNYEIILNRTNTIKINLIKDGNNISAHTATATYKIIQEIIGIDFKTFVQLIYQSSTNSLEFLTSTDTARKTFLISLFNLKEYTFIYNKIKDINKEYLAELNQIQGSLNTVQKWINTHKEINRTKKNLLNLPEFPDDDIKKLKELELDFENAEKRNKLVNKNEEYKKLLKTINVEDLSKPISKPESKLNYIEQKATLQSNIQRSTKIISQIEKLEDKCPTCKQEVDKDFIQHLIDIEKSSINDWGNYIKEIEETISNIKKQELEYEDHQKLVKRFEELYNLIDHELDNSIIDKNETKREIDNLNIKINKIKSQISNIQKQNEKIEAENSKIDLIENQLIEYGKLLDKTQEKLDILDELVSKLEILKKIFSTTGLVNYKIEYLVKDLEKYTNKYLSELFQGNIQISFTLQGDKLNIVIITKDNIVNIETLSAGELARINISTLLAIRYLMTAISNTKINLLFLDEIMGVLDDEGREKLINVLDEEKDLNTFIVSHEWEHPLIPKISIIKENNISRIIHYD